MSERPNFYRAIHKTLRRALALFLADLGAVNPEDAGALASITSRWEGLHRMMEGHAHHEDAHLGAALAEAAPDLLRRIEADHLAHHRGLEAVARAMAELKAAAPAARALRLQEAYLAVAAFMATDLAHMQLEEEGVMPALQARFDDAHLMGLHGQILASMPPEEKAQIFIHMFPAIHELERVEVLQGLRAKAPAEVFEGFTRLVAAVLPEGEWASLQRRLDPVPA